MRIWKPILEIVQQNTTPITELPRDFCAGIGPLLVFNAIEHRGGEDGFENKTFA